MRLLIKLRKNTKPCKSYLEAQWVDFYLHKISSYEQNRMIEHRKACKACQAISEEWARIPLIQAGSSVQIELQGAKASLHTHYQESYQKQLHKQKRLKKQRFNRYMMSGAAIALLFIGLAILQQSIALKSKPSYEIANEYIRMQSPQAVSFIQAAQPLPFSFELASHAWNNGYVWINSNEKELYVWLEHIYQPAEHDFQVWTLSKAGVESIGLIEQIGLQGHLHVKDDRIADLEQLQVSIEPLGGSKYPSKQAAIIFKQSLH